MSYGPEFRWFAWHPVHTDDRGWRWLRFVWRRREYAPAFLPEAPGPWWSHRVDREVVR